MRMLLDSFVTGGYSPGYASALRDALRAAHEVVLRPASVDARESTAVMDLAHIYYRSLVLDTYREVLLPAHPELSQEPIAIRDVFPVGDVTESLVSYASWAAGRYEDAPEILPDIECGLCSILFCPDGLHDDEAQEHIENGVYPLGPTGLQCLLDLVTSEGHAGVPPWLWPDLHRSMSSFQMTQGKLPALWSSSVRGPLHRGYQLPGRFDDIAQLALCSSFVTLDVVSGGKALRGSSYMARAEDTDEADDAWQENARARLMRVYGDRGWSISSPPRRALTFVLIRTHPPMGAECELSRPTTIGLVVYYSDKPIPLDEAASLAIVERVLYYACRQIEMQVLQRHYSDAVMRLEIDRLVAQLMAHELSKPFAMTQSLMQALGRAMSASEKITASFTQGELSSREEAPVDLYDIIDSVSARYVAGIDSSSTAYTSRVRRGTYVKADRRALDFVLGVLIGNALDHGEGHVVVSAQQAEQTEGGSPAILVRVENDGAPMPRRVASAILAGRPLRRAGHGSGHGIGLALAYEYARHLPGWAIAYRLGGDEFRHIFELRLPQVG